MLSFQVDYSTLALALDDANSADDHQINCQWISKTVYNKTICNVQILAVTGNKT